jgi:integrase/recombinase XerD
MLSTCDAEMIEIWLEKQSSLYTRGCYRFDSERFLDHAKKPLSRITLADLQNFAQSLTTAGLAPISCSRTLAAVKSLFGFCHRLRYLPINPAAELTLPSYENRLAERILAEEDVQRMLAAETEPRDRVLLRLLYAAGLRVSEACHLLWRHLRPRGEAGQITVFGKNGRTRAIALPAEV